MINSTGMLANYTLGVEPSGRELLVVVVKESFRFPQRGEMPTRLDEQLPLIMADTFTGEPGFSAPLEEVDFAPRKLRCDIMLSASALAPNGRPTDRVTVGVRVGGWTKSFSVVGDRQWVSGVTGIRSTTPVPFVRMPISYDVAFGGLDAFHEDLAEHKAFMLNPVGRGWHYHLKSKYVDGSPMPNTEEIGRSVTAPNGSYLPMSFGPVGRGWSSRLPLAGTYDQHWIDNVFPFLPADFRDEYYQAAPSDQQVPYLQGGEEVMLLNMTEGGRTVFRLPALDIPVTFFNRIGGHDERKAALDTLVLMPDKGVFTMTWRVALPLRKNIFEISEVLIGHASRAWWRARELGKTYYPSLDNLPRVEEAESA